MAITLAAARLGAILGNLAFGGLVDVACAVPILLVAALLIGNINQTGSFHNINITSSFYIMQAVVF